MVVSKLDDDLWSFYSCPAAFQSSGQFESDMLKHCVAYFKSVRHCHSIPNLWTSKTGKSYPMDIAFAET